MAEFMKERIIEELKASTQNANGMFEIGEDTICNLMSMLTYAVPQLPQPAVPDMATVETTYPDVQTNWQDAKMYAEGWNACRAAMLQAGNSPVIPDDVRRMDWLVSKTVDVREPMVYGSYSIFWSQTTTDQEDDYHATKLREQIDAAMAAEQAAAPQQEVTK
ncbi:hypothetical protein ABHD38_25180 [Enterobacter cloacae]|uniref:hypothetical protein n=1 Tax=Enterobacter cloacae TaxID=550 RepID=UPI00325B6F50